MLRQLEATTGWIVAQSEANPWIQLLRQANGFKSFVFNPRFGGRLICLLNFVPSDAQSQRGVMFLSRIFAHLENACFVNCARSAGLL